MARNTTVVIHTAAIAHPAPTSVGQRTRRHTRDQPHRSQARPWGPNRVGVPSAARLRLDTTSLVADGCLALWDGTTRSAHVCQPATRCTAIVCGKRFSLTRPRGRRRTSQPPAPRCARCGVVVGACRLENRGRSTTTNGARRETTSSFSCSAASLIDPTRSLACALTSAFAATASTVSPSSCRVRSISTRIPRREYRRSQTITAFTTDLHTAPRGSVTACPTDTAVRQRSTSPKGAAVGELGGSFERLLGPRLPPAEAGASTFGTFHASPSTSRGTHPPGMRCLVARMRCVPDVALVVS